MIHTLCLFLQYAMWEILSNELKYLFYTKRWLLYLHMYYTNIIN